jgi:hypothetical protein
MASGKRRRLAGLTKQESPVEIRKRLLHERMERQQSKSLLAVLLPVLVVIALIVGFGAYWEGWYKPRQPIAKVTLGQDGPSETITAQDFVPRVQYQRNQIIQNLENLKGLSISDPSILNSMAKNQRDGVGTAVQDLLVDEALVRIEAEKRGVTVSEADIQSYLINNDSRLSLALLGSPTPLPSATATVEVKATSAASSTPMPTPTVMSEEAIALATAERATVVAAIPASKFEGAVRREVEPGLQQIGLSRAEYLKVIREAVLRENLNKAMGAEIADKEPQLEAEFLRFVDKASAEAAAKAAAGGASWSDLVSQFGPREEAAADAADAAGDDAAGDDVAADDTAGDDAAAGSPEPSPEATGEGGPIFLQATATAEAAGTEAAGDAAAPTAVDAPADGTAVAPEAPTAAATTVPTPTPDPFASAASAEAKWLTRHGLKTDTDFGLTDEAELDQLLQLKAGGVSAALQSSNGFLVIHAKNVDAARAVDKTELTTRRDNAVQDWLTMIKDAKTDEARRAKIDKFPFDDKIPAEPVWFVTYMDGFLNAPAAPTIDIAGLGSQGSISIGTVAPSADDAGAPEPTIPDATAPDAGAPAEGEAPAVATGQP